MTSPGHRPPGAGAAAAPSAAHPDEVAALGEAARALGLAPADAELARLLAYRDLIARWNRVYNLTAVRGPADMRVQHLHDSLSVVGPLRRHTGGRAVRLLDVGSGAGLPGVVLAISCPEVDVHCVDTVAKKADFIRQVALTLKLPNLHAHHARVEALEAGAFDVITSRAFASLADFVALTRGLLAEGGVWMALKGVRPQAEIDALQGIDVFHVEPLAVPGLEAQRCLVWMRPAG